MVSPFWTNTIWYVLLGAATIAELIFAISKAENRRQTIAFFLTIFGLTLFIETPLLIFLKAYTYFPFIFKHVSNPFDDDLAGSFFSELSIAATLLFVVIRKLKPYWYLIFAILYGLIEVCFLRLGIYSHNWYQTWITIVMLPLAFLLIKIMYTKIQLGIKPFLYFGYFILALFPLNVITITWAFMLTGVQEMSYKVLPDPIMSRHSIALVLFFLFCIPLMWIYFARLKLHWKAIVFMGLTLLYYIAYRMNFVLIKEGWLLIVCIVTLLWMYYSIYLLDRLYGQPINAILKN